MNPKQSKPERLEVGSVVSKLMSQHRWCYMILPTQNPAIHGGFIPSICIEDQPGHYPLMGRGEGAGPWVWGDTLEKAEAICDEKNKALGLSELDVTKIVASTFRASRPKRVKRTITVDFTVLLNPGIEADEVTFEIPYEHIRVDTTDGEKNVGEVVGYCTQENI